jgi:hypothetical protein
MSTVKPSSQSEFINGSALAWSNGSPPVSSTSGSFWEPFIAAYGEARRSTSARTSAKVFLPPSVNA